MKKVFGVATCLLSMACAQVPFANAAMNDSLVGELHLIHGKVLVSKGKGYRLSGSAKTGDRILVGKDGSALLTFPGGCDVQLQPGQVYVVPSVAPCAIAQTPPPPPPAAPPPVPLAAEPVFDSTTAIIAGGVVGIAAIGAGAYFLFASKS